MFPATEIVLLFVSRTELTIVASSGILHHIYFLPTFTYGITICSGSFVLMKAESSLDVISLCGSPRILGLPSKTRVCLIDGTFP